MRVPMKLTLSLLAATVLTPLAAWAETVDKIKITGNERVESATVRSYLGIREGEAYSVDKTRRALKDLYGTGLFDNVEINWDKGVLQVVVAENPIVNQIAFEGNENLKDEQLKKAVSLHARSIFTPGKVQQDVTEILAAYRQIGRYLAKVDPQIIRRDQNRVDVVYSITEGERTRIRRIDFVGNRDFSDGDLKDVVATRESAWWRFLTDADNYDPDRLEFDKELLRRYYLKNGYADFRVVSAIAELSPDKRDFFITYTLEEGPVYNFGTADVRLSDKNVDVSLDDLRKDLKVKPGQVYDASLIDKDIDTLVDALGRKGYAFLDVVPLLDKDDKNRVVNITYDVRPGPRVYVNRINILGNTRTRDNVLRREMRLSEGDAFSSNKLRRSQDRLQVLGFFEKVDIKRKETNQPDKVDLDVNVKEQSTGEFNIGAGYSSYEGALATTELRERNFLGRGQDVSVSFALSEERQDFDVSFTEPYFMNRELSATVQAFNSQRVFQDQSSYDQTTTGGGFSLGFPLNEYLKNTVSTTYRNTEISNVPSSASQFVKREAGKSDSFVVGNTVSYDTRDNYLNPNRGTRLSGSVEYSGFGTDVNYLRTQVSGSYYYPLGEQWVLSVGGRAGYLFDINNDTPIFENFYAGGQNLRGFDRGGIGPRDRITNDALGGQAMVGHNVELRFPIAFMDELGVNGVLFSDGGMVTQFEDGNANVIDSKTYRVSVGTGIFWQSPLGPLRFDFGFPLVKASEDQTQVFSFNFGTRF